MRRFHAAADTGPDLPGSSESEHAALLDLLVRRIEHDDGAARLTGTLCSPAALSCLSEACSLDGCGDRSNGRRTD